MIGASIVLRGNTVANRAGGFSLIEMMVVIAIIGILALLAAPNFQDSIVRAEIKEALPLADLAKQPIAATWRTTIASRSCSTPIWTGATRSISPPIRPARWWTG